MGKSKRERIEKSDLIFLSGNLNFKNFFEKPYIEKELNAYEKLIKEGKAEKAKDIISSLLLTDELVNNMS